MNRNIVAAAGIIIQALAGGLTAYATSETARTEISNLKTDVLNLKFGVRDLQVVLDKISRRQDINTARDAEEESGGKK